MTIIGVDLYIGMGEPLKQDREYQDRLKEGQMLIRNGRRKRDRRSRRQSAGSSSSNSNRIRSESKQARWSSSGRIGAARGRYEQIISDGGV